MKMTLPGKRTLDIEITEIDKDGKEIQRTETFILSGTLDTLLNNGEAILDELKNIDTKNYKSIKRVVELSKDYICVSLSNDKAINIITGQDNADLDTVLFVTTSIMQELNTIQEKEQSNLLEYLPKNKKEVM